MKVCIVGGGKIGYYVARTLLSHRHSVVLIEEREAVCSRRAGELDIPVYCGNGTDPQVLQRAGCSECDVLVGVTGQDQCNLVACQLAKKLFFVKKTVARVNNPENAAVLQLLEVEVETDAIRQLLQLSDGETSLREIRLPEDFAFSGQTLAQLPLPEELTVVSVTRGGRLIIPRGQTRILAGDTLLCLARAAGFVQLSRKWKLH